MLLISHHVPVRYLAFDHWMYKVCCLVLNHGISLTRANVCLWDVGMYIIVMFTCASLSSPVFVCVAPIFISAYLLTLK